MNVQRMLFSGRRRHCKLGVPRMLHTCIAPLTSMDATWTQHPWKSVQNVIYWATALCCVFFIIILASRSRLMGVAPLRGCSLIANLACTATAPKPWESCTAFKPRNFPETTMQHCHKTSDWKHAASFILLHIPSFRALPWAAAYPQNSIWKWAVNVIRSLRQSFCQLWWLLCYSLFHFLCFFFPFQKTFFIVASYFWQGRDISGTRERKDGPVSWELQSHLTRASCGTLASNLGWNH